MSAEQVGNGAAETASQAPSLSNILICQGKFPILAITEAIQRNTAQQYA